MKKCLKYFFLGFLLLFRVVKFAGILKKNKTFFVKS